MDQAIPQDWVESVTQIVEEAGAVPVDLGRVPRAARRSCVRFFCRPEKCIF